MNIPHITICIATCGRPKMLDRLLREIARQQTGGLFTFSVVVTDNDKECSARPVIDAFNSDSGTKVVYAIEPERNIAVVRNTALAHASGDFIVFIDDDEFPVPDWLRNLFQTCQEHKVAGVLGPVKPHFDQKPPSWLVKGGFYDRPTHPTGFLMGWEECRTGNVLFRFDILDPMKPPFDREFRTGGEDRDFFRRMIQKGHKFIWCDEAVAYETVPTSRWSRRFLLSRALLRGRISLQHPKHRVRIILKSLVAVPVYTLALPFLLVAGHHYFMKYLVRLTDHIGRLLAVVRLNPMRDRPM
jgi:succinoglycan biosynthesis protein ExoM